MFLATELETDAPSDEHQKSFSQSYTISKLFHASTTWKQRLKVKSN